MRQIGAFRPSRSDCARLSGHRILERVSKCRAVVSFIMKILSWWNEAVKSVNFTITWPLWIVRVSIFDIKMDAQSFDTIHDILRCLRLMQYLLKRRNAQTWRMREPTHMRLSVTGGLIWIQDKKKCHGLRFLVGLNFSHKKPHLPIFFSKIELVDPVYKYKV